MIIVAENGDFYETNTATRMHRDIGSGDPVEYKLCISYGAVWNGSGLTENTYELIATTDQNLREFIVGQITQAFLGSNNTYNVADGIAEYNE